MLILRSTLSVFISISLFFIAIDSLAQMECITKSKLDFFMHSSTHLINPQQALFKRRSLRCDNVVIQLHSTKLEHQYQMNKKIWRYQYQSYL